MKENHNNKPLPSLLEFQVKISFEKGSCYNIKFENH